MDDSMIGRFLKVAERRGLAGWLGAVGAGWTLVAAGAAGLAAVLGTAGWAAAWGMALLLAPPLLLLSWLAFSLARGLAAERARQVLVAVEDDLTGVANRRHFLALVEREFARCRRYGEESALLMISADHLRRINAHLGQACGNALLLEVSRRIGLTLRQPDLPARFGGAEIAVFLPKTDPLGALDVAERIRQKVASAPFVWEKNHVVATVSIGVATVHAGQLSVDTLVLEAEQALESAKEAGRNCVRAGPIKPRRNDESRRVTRS